MPYPPEIIQREIFVLGDTFYLNSGLEEEGLTRVLEVYASQKRMVWVGNYHQEPVVAWGGKQVHKFSPSQDAVISLPVTDQMGWSDGRGGIILGDETHHTHSYRIVGYLYDEPNNRKLGSTMFTVGPFVLPRGNMSRVNGAALVSVHNDSIHVSLPDVWSEMLADAQEATAEVAALVAAFDGAEEFVDYRIEQVLEFPVDPVVLIENVLQE